MATSVKTTRSAASPLGIALAFLGMFVVGSLGVQLLASLPGRSDAAPAVGGSRADGPAVVAHPASLWSTLGER